MPNSQNYKSSINSYTDAYNKFTVSRIVNTAQNPIIQIEKPAEFPTTLAEATIEIHVYTLDSDRLLNSIVVNNNSDIITTRTFQYDDSTTRELLFIDFSKIYEYIPVGLYTVVFNFFLNEIGSYDNKSLQITRISPSRREVELKLTDSSELNKLKKFYGPSVNNEWILPMMKQIFNQPDAPTNVPALSGSLNSQVILSYIPSASNLQTYGFLDDDDSKPGVRNIIQKVMNLSYGYATASIDKHILENSGSFTYENVLNYVTNAIDDGYEIVFQDFRQNPEQYRFDLI